VDAEEDIDIYMCMYTYVYVYMCICFSQPPCDNWGDLQLLKRVGMRVVCLCVHVKEDSVFKKKGSALVIHHGTISVTCHCKREREMRVGNMWGECVWCVCVCT